MGHDALTIVEDGKEVPWGVVQTSQDQEP